MIEPPGECDYRGPDPCSADGPAGPMSGTGGLVGGTAADRRGDKAESRKPATGSAGRAGEGTRRLAADRVHPLSVVALGRFQLQSHLLRDAEEPANRMRLPTCHFHQLGERRTLGSLQEGDLSVAKTGFADLQTVTNQRESSGPEAVATPGRVETVRRICLLRKCSSVRTIRALAPR